MTLLFACSLLSAAPASAVQYRGTGGRPAYPREDNPRTDSIFVHILEPGDVKTDGIRVINNDAETKTLLVYAADSTPSSSGGFACKQLLDTQTGVGNWIQLEKSEVTLEPGTNEIVDFTINVPENADTGEHNGCILIQEKLEDDPTDPDRPAGMHLSFRTGLRVIITVPGELRREIALAGLVVERRGSQPGFLYKAKVENKGNVSTDTNVIIKTTTMFGREIKEHGGQYTILRGDVSELNFEMPRPFWGGWYTATLTADYDPNPNVEIGTESGQRETLSVDPVTYFSMPQTTALAIEIGSLALILFIAGIISLQIKRAQWVRKTWVAYEVKDGEDLNAIAKKFDVSWKLLARAHPSVPGQHPPHWRN